jgi:hypothetical protein
LSDKIKIIIVTKYPIYNISSTANICTPNTNIENKGSYVICSPDALDFLPIEIAVILCEYPYNKGRIALTSTNIESGIAVIHGEAPLLKIFNNDKFFMNFLVSLEELEIWLDTEIDDKEDLWWAVKLLKDTGIKIKKWNREKEL